MPSAPDSGPGPDSPADLIAQLETQRPQSAPGPAPAPPTVTRHPAEPVPPFSQTEPIPTTAGTIVDLTQVTTHPYAISASGTADEMLAQSWRQLTAFNDLCQMLSAADTLDALVQILVENLRQAIPNAQRGAVLLPDQQGELLLKAHWPPGDHSVSMTWIKRAYDRREPFIWSAAAESTAGNDTPQSAIYYSVQSAMYVPLMLGGQALGVMYVDNYLTHKAFFGTDLELMRAIANQVAMFVRDHVLRKDLKREEKLRSHLSRQFSPKIAERIFANGRRLQIGGERMDPVTILVSDVRNFTVLSSKMEPDKVVRMLNEMFDAFVPIIFEHDGGVDKYIGDSVLAVFGSPEKDDRQCEKAVRAALEMQHAVHKLQEGRRVRRLPIFDVGISIHTGEVIHGFIGSAERMEYTVIGDTVNQASRYCDGAGAGEVVISKTVYEHVYHLVNVQPKVIRTKHPESEPDLEAFVVKGLKKGTPGCSG
jgi:adenylate cyclase